MLPNLRSHDPTAVPQSHGNDQLPGVPVPEFDGDTYTSFFIEGTWKAPPYLHIHSPPFSLKVPLISTIYPIINASRSLVNGGAGKK
jgi:hypothetical protein